MHRLLRLSTNKELLDRIWLPPCRRNLRAGEELLRIVSAVGEAEGFFRRRRHRLHDRQAIEAKGLVLGFIVAKDTEEVVFHLEKTFARE